MLPELAKRNSFVGVDLIGEAEGGATLDAMLAVELGAEELGAKELDDALIEEETLLDCGALVG